MVIVGDLESTTEGIRVLKKETRVEMCNNTLTNALREERLSIFAKVPKPALSQKNI